MRTAAICCMIGLIASPIIAGLLALFKRTKDYSYGMFIPGLLFAGGWLITHTLALRENGLFQTIGRTSHTARILLHPSEATGSFWFNILIGSFFAGMGLVIVLIILVTGVREWLQKFGKNCGRDEISESE